MVRLKAGGQAIGSVQVHAVTTVNALRHQFSLGEDPIVRVVTLLQAAAVVADHYVRLRETEGRLRPVNLLDLGSAGAPAAGGSMAEVFAGLPFKARGYEEKDPSERAASDASARQAFGLVLDRRGQEAFLRRARGLVCRKAGLDAHDIKFPAAMFEESMRAGAEWRPYLLAASVHALHGERSDDSPALREVMMALRHRG
jgi:hypothetical protein